MMSTPNIPLLRKCVEWAEMENEKGPLSEWNQGRWAGELRQSFQERTYQLDQTLLAVPQCGTTHCIAGHAAHLAGYTTNNGLRIRPKHEWPEIPDGYCSPMPEDDWQSLGAALLGLSETEALELFSGTNTIEAVREVAERIAADHGEVL